MVKGQSPELQVRPGSGLSLSKCFRPILGRHTEFFYNIRINDLFLSWNAFVMLTPVTSVSEVIVIFLQLFLFANTAAFFYSLLGLVSHSLSEGDSGKEISTRWMWHCVKKINHLTLFFACVKKRWPTIRHFMSIALSWIVPFMPIAPSWIVCFYVEKHYILQYALTNKLGLCLFKLMFWSRWLLFWVW